MVYSFWIGFLIGLMIMYSLTRADFYIQLARGNFVLRRPMNKFELTIVGNVRDVRERRNKINKR